MRSFSRVRRLIGAFLLCTSTTALFAGDNKPVPAPSFTLKNQKGENYVLEQNLGRGPIVINFWSTCCGPCILEMKNSKKIFEKYAPLGLQWLSVSIDDNKTQSKIGGIVRTYKFPYEILLDENKDVFRAFKANSPPDLFILNAQGMIVYKHHGYQKGDEKKVDAVIAKLLRGKK